MGLLERLLQKSRTLALSGAVALGFFSSGCESPQGTWAAGGIAGANALYNTSLSPQASAGLGLASTLLQGAAIIQQGQETQEMIRQQQRSSQQVVSPPEDRASIMRRYGITDEQYISQNSSSSASSDPFLQKYNLPDVGSVELVVCNYAEDANHNGSKDYPYEYHGLRTGKIFTFSPREKIYIELRTGSKSFRKFVTKIVDGEGEVVQDISSEDYGDNAQKSGGLAFENGLSEGKYTVVCYGTEYNPQSFYTPPPKKSFFGKVLPQSYTPPPPHVERTLFLGSIELNIKEKSRHSIKIDNSGEHL